MYAESALWTELSPQLWVFLLHSGLPTRQDVLWGQAPTEAGFSQLRRGYRWDRYTDQHFVTGSLSPTPTSW